MQAASPLQVQSLFLFVTAATPAGTMGRLSTTECTYLPTWVRGPPSSFMSSWPRAMGL